MYSIFNWLFVFKLLMCCKMELNEIFWRFTINFPSNLDHVFRNHFKAELNENNWKKIIIVNRKNMLKSLTYSKVFIFNCTILTIKDNNDNKCLSVFKIIYINNKNWNYFRANTYISMILKRIQTSICTFTINISSKRIHFWPF